MTPPLRRVSKVPIERCKAPPLLAWREIERASKRQA